MLRCIFLYSKLLNNIVTIKMEQYEMSKIRSQTPEEYLKTFFEAELRSLWPAGWMNARYLFSNCTFWFDRDLVLYHV